MSNYFVGAIGLIIFIAYYYFLGAAIRKESAPFALNIIYGYIIFSFFSAVFLIPIQLFNFPWAVSCTILISLWIMGVIFILFRIQRRDLILTRGLFKNILKNNYYLFVIAAFLMGIYFLQYDLIWINNHLDDGYYLVKIATLPYLENPFNTVYAVGLEGNTNTFNSYLLSSYELEQSIYAFLLHIDPVIYCRIILNYFNYFLIASTISAFSEVLLKDLDLVKPTIYQYFSSILLLFSFEYLWLQNKGLFIVQDSWQFSSAMWYGSSIGRMAGLMWIVILFFNIKKISFKEVLLAFILCVTLISKSAISIPVLFVGGISFLVVFFFTQSKKSIYLGLLLLLGLTTIGIILPNNEHTNNLIIDIFIQNRHSIVLIGSVLVSLWGLLKFHTSKNVVRVIIFLAFCCFMIIVPELNDSFEMISMYDFVARRFQSTLLYTTMVLGFIFMLVFINVYMSYMSKLSVIVSIALLIVGAVGSTIPVYGNPLNTIEIMMSNPYNMSAYTVELSKTLGAIEDSELVVLSPDWVTDTGHRHSLAVMLRTYAPNIINLSAIPRYAISEDSPYSSFGQEQQNIFNSFISSPNEYNYQMLEYLLTEFSIECIVIPNDSFEFYVDRSAFSLYEKTDIYYIYLRN